MHSAVSYGVLAVSTLAYAVHGATISVDVGEGGLAFKPNSITAAKGDVIKFHFYPQDHSVVQGSFNSPCFVGNVTGGFNSGFVPSKSGEASQVFQVTISSTDPIYFYCSQVSHCQNGMVGVINGPSSGNTLDAYKSAAALTSLSESPTSVTGGVLVANSGDDDSSSNSSGAAESSTGAPVSSSSSSAKVSTTRSTSALATTGAGSTPARGSVKSNVTSITSSAAGSAKSSVANIKSSAASVASSQASKASSGTIPTFTGNVAAGLGRVSYEMLVLVGVAGGVAVIM